MSILFSFKVGEEVSIFVYTTVAGLARVEKLNYSVLYMVGSADGTVQNSFQQT